MTGAFVILIAMIVIGIVLYLTDVFYYRKKHPAPGGSPQPHDAAKSDTPPMAAADDTPGEPEVCCGMHTVCEKTNLSPVTGDVVYYDDEELDRFKGREADRYEPDEVEEFRDVMLTMRPEEVAGWSRSLQVRGITLPADVREELLMIVADLRGR